MVHPRRGWFNHFGCELPKSWSRKKLDNHEYNEVEMNEITYIKGAVSSPLKLRAEGVAVLSPLIEECFSSLIDKFLNHANG